MRFQVPQFLEVEDKIFGPFTLKQFVYLAGGAGITVAAFSFLPKFLALLVASPFIGVSLALTFYKVNNKPFIFHLEAIVKYFSSARLYIWKKKERKAQKSSLESVSQGPEVYVPKLSDSKLKDLSWSLDVKEANTSNVNTNINND